MLSTGSMEKSGFSVIDSEELFRINGGADQSDKDDSDDGSEKDEKDEKDKKKIEFETILSSAGSIEYDPVSDKPVGKFEGKVEHKIKGEK